MNAFELVIANSSFLKRVKRYVIICIAIAKILISYCLLRKGDTGICNYCKTIPNANRTLSHNLMVMNLDGRMMMMKTKMVVCGQTKIR